MSTDQDNPVEFVEKLADRECKSPLTCKPDSGDKESSCPPCLARFAITKLGIQGWPRWISEIVEKVCDFWEELGEIQIQPSPSDQDDEWTIEFSPAVDDEGNYSKMGLVDLDGIIDLFDHPRDVHLTWSHSRQEVIFSGIYQGNDLVLRLYDAPQNVEGE